MIMAEEAGGLEKSSFGNSPESTDVAVTKAKPTIITSSEKSNISESLPDKFRIKEGDRKLVSALWNTLPAQLREEVLQKIERVVYPDHGKAIGHGLVTPSRETEGLFNVNIGPCFEPKYCAEIFYHEINHVISEDVISREMRDKMNDAANTLRNELKQEGAANAMDASHLLVNILPIYILYPQVFNRLSTLYKGWDMAGKVYKELLGEIPSQKRREIFQELENIKNKPAPSVSPDAAEFLESIRKGQEAGYLSRFFNKEIGGLLQLLQLKDVSGSSDLAAEVKQQL